MDNTKYEKFSLSRLALRKLNGNYRDAFIEEFKMISNKLPG